MALVLLSSRHFDNKRLILVVTGCSFALMIVGLSSTTLVERVLSFEHVGEVGSLVGRAKVWGGVTEMIRDHPIFGVGPGNFANAVARYLPPAENRHYYAHNDYLQLVSVIGLPVILVIFWMMVCTYKRGFKKLKNQSRLVRGTTVGALSGITAILIHSTVDFNLNIPANAILFTVLVALAVCPLPSDNR
jgi:O-antigen ligase